MHKQLLALFFPYLYLRPIPRGQLDGMEMTDEEKAAYQNPGYN